ncbi:hypothetical protein EJF36_19035 [Bacillus sp. HMF5848]|uniref:S41 family peptidase n=1 Tax=Bacillus sp. HMF5848 TaxID=2495421 RepID=UPI000F77DCFE|nr:S41 family peptidase [Bacillus sp. HMF5848]RSK28801.1 hypothetical protein EJF36_19035 [Bacillus sp. HMF5848]
MKKRKVLRIGLFMLVGVIATVLIIQMVARPVAMSSQESWQQWEDLQSETQDIKVKHWEEDINYMFATLEDKHKNLYHTTSEEAFLQEKEKLINSLDGFTDIEVFIELKKMIAKVGDSHTSIRYDIPFHWFPIQFYRFDDGWYVVRVAKEFEKLLGLKVMKIGDTPVDEIFASMSVMIEHENEAELNLNFPFVAKNAELLQGFQIIDNLEQATFVFQDEVGKELAVTMPTYFHKDNDYETISIFDNLDVNEQPLFKQELDDWYSYTFLPEHEALYIQYKQCMNDKNNPFSDFRKEVLEQIDKQQPEKILFDVRHNGGGNSLIAMRLINGIAKKQKDLGYDVYILIGRSTYSSAILNAIDLKKKTNGMFVGEATGGSPNHYGEVKVFNLPNSGLRVSYSTKYFKNYDTNEPTIRPDIEVPQLLSNYLAGKDPEVEAVLNLK